MLKYRLFILLGFLTSALHVPAQQAAFDSLKNQLNERPDSAKMRFLKRLESLTKNEPDPERALQWAQRLHDYAEAERDTFSLLNACGMLCDVYKRKNDAENTEKYATALKKAASVYGWRVDAGFKTVQKSDLLYSTELAPHLLVLYDLQGDYTIEQVASPEWSGRFGLNNTMENGVDADAVYWVKIKLRGSDAEDGVYYFTAGHRQNTWQYVDVYTPGPGGAWARQRSGAALQPAQKSIRDAYSIFKVSLRRREEKTIYIRLEKTGTSPNPAVKQIALRYFSADSLLEFGGYRPTSSAQNAGGRYGFYYGATIWRSLEFVEDSSGSAGLEALRARWDRESRFATEFKPKGNVFWTRLRLIGRSKENQKLLIDLTPQESVYPYIDVYIPDKSGTYQRLQTGYRVSPDRKPVDHQLNLCRVELRAGDTMDVYVRMERAAWIGVESLNMLGMIHLDEEKFWTKQARNNYIGGMTTGTMLFLMLFCLALFLVTLERLYFFFSMMALGVLAFSYFIFYHPFFGFSYVAFSLPVLFLGVLLTAWGFLKYSEYFLEIRRFLPRSYRLSNAISILLLVCSLILAALVLRSILQPTFKTPRWVLLVAVVYVKAIIAALSLPLYYGIVAWRRKYRPARFFLLSNILFIGGTILFLILILLAGALQATDSTSAGGTGLLEKIAGWSLVVSAISFLVSLILFAVGIGYRTNLLKKEKENALQQGLAAEKTLNERLRAVDKLKDQFLANTSHELRTPLQGIIGLSESMLEEEKDADKKENLSMIVSSGRRLNSLVNDILDFSKLRNHEISLTTRPVSLHALADVVLRNLAPLARAKNIRLINDIAPEFPAVAADEDRLLQVLYNLTGNAIKFTETGLVRIGAQTAPVSERPTRESSEMCSFFVEDTGIGIAADKREAVFQDFVQADGSSERKFSGTGLGLPISKRLIELHGGRMWFESTLGKGSTFFFSLPKSNLPALSGMPTVVPTPSLRVRTEPEAVRGFAGAPEDAAIPPAAAPGVAAESLPAPEETDLVHLLVVDDEVVNHQVLKNYLSKERYHITAAMSGAEALKLLDSNRHFDLVLLDVMMPFMSGYEVCQKIREKRPPNELPVIMITAKSQVADLVEGLNTGANDYIAKPFSKDEFLARIKMHLNLLKINTVAGRFVPNEFIRSLGRENLSDVRLGDHVEQEVTVLFADIRDYTSLAEQLSPEDNFRFVQGFNQRMGPIIQKNGGFINQYLGDGIMAIFRGGPQDALRAAIEMQEVLRNYNLQRHDQNRRPIHIGIGMHTGPLIMGIIGDQKRLDATTVADTVNTASRLEGLTKYYHANILLSQRSFDLLPEKARFHLRYLGQAQVKGKTAYTGIYECFDGDEPEQIEQKKATLADFALGLEAYFRKDFTGAIAAFRKAAAFHTACKTTRLFLEKALHYGALDTLPEDWTGAEQMGQK